MPANIVELRRVVHIQGKTTGVKEAAGDLKRLDTAYAGVSVQAEKVAKATLSEERALRALQTRLDPAFRATEKLAAAERTLNAAQAQGLISLARKNELMALAIAETNRAAVATGRLAAAQRGLSGVGGAALGAAGLGGGAAVTGILAAGYAVSAFIKNSIEAQKSLAQLNAVLQSTGGAAGLTAEELTGLASEMQRLTTYDDEAVLSAESLLLTFTRIGADVFPDATKAVLDMSAALGQDLKSSSIQLGKALNDPIAGINALRRVGVSFTESQKDMIKSLVEAGKMADAQRLILKELQTEFGGSAQAARNTLGGALTALGNAFGDLFEVSGEGSKNLTASINELTDTLSDPATIAAIQDFGAALLDAISAATKALTFFIENAKVVMEILRFIGSGGVGAAGVGFDLGAGSQVVNETAAGFKKLQDSAKAAADAVTEVAPPIRQVTDDLGTLKKEVDGIPTPRTRDSGLVGLREQFERVEKSAASFTSTLVSGLIQGEGIVGSLADAIGGLSSNFGNLASGFLNRLGGGGIVGSILGGLGGGIVSSLVGGIGSIIQSIFGDNDEEERLRRREERQRRQEARDRREERLERQEERRLARREQRHGYQDRAFMAGLDTSTLGGQLAAFDREALRERQDLAASIHNARRRAQMMAELEGALAAERLAIIQEFNAQVLAEEQAAREARIEDARDDLRRAYEAERDILVQVRDRALAFAASMKELRDSIRLDRSVSILSPAQRLAEARRQFEATAGLAQSGDETAMGQLAGIAQTYLTEARDFFASSPEYAAIFGQVDSILAQLGAGATDQASIAEQQLAALDTQVGALITLNESVLSVTQAIANLQLAITGQKPGLAAVSSILPSKNFASGGWVTGGMAGRDSVPAMLTPGEYVLNRAQAQTMAPGNDNAVARAVVAGTVAQINALREENASLRAAIDRLNNTIRIEANRPRQYGTKAA